MDNNITKENVPIINDKSKYMDTYVDKVEEKMEVAEKEGKGKYTYLSAIEVIYHFVHLQNDMDEKKNRKEDTKKSYVSEILLFC